MRSAVFTGISAIWNFCNFWNSKQKFEIPALLQGGTIYLVSPVKNSELSNKNCRRSSDLKQKLTDGRRTTDDDGQSDIVSGAKNFNACLQYLDIEIQCNIQNHQSELFFSW